MVEKRTTELWLIFVLVGILFVAPVISGEALGRTTASVKATWSPVPTILNTMKGEFVEKHLDEGKFVVEPPARCDSESQCKWVTAGTGAFGGPEAAHTIYKYFYSDRTDRPPEQVAIVKFWLYNPRSGANTCGGVVLWAPSNKVGAGCDISQGTDATVKYWVNYRLY